MAGKPKVTLGGALRALLVLAFRYVTGQHLDGKRRGDATFLADGTEAEAHYWGRGGDPWWARLAGWKRGLIRLAAAAAVWGLLFHRLITAVLLATLAVPLLAILGVRTVRGVREFRHYQAKVRPLSKALVPVLGVPRATRPKALVKVPQDYAENPAAAIVVYPPPEFTGSDREMDDVKRAVTVKLGIEAPDMAALLHARRPQIAFTKSEPPPAKVLFGEILPAVRAAAEHEVIAGIGKKGQLIVVSVDNDSPHVGFSMGSGDGKSATARNWAAQMLHHGSLLMVLDYKLISHMWARGLPNVAYAGTPEEIEAALVWLAAEVTRRNQVALAGADIEGQVHASVGPRILLIAEELNATQNRLKAWWNREMEMKGRSPGSEALDEVMFLGRQVHVNVIQIGQRLSVKASGSGDARENLGVLVFADPTASAWKMLVGDRHALPPASGHTGRQQIVTRKEVRETQGAFLTGQQAHDFALAGTVAEPRLDMPCVTRVPVGAGQPQLERHGAPGLPSGVGQAPVVQGPPGLVTVREMATAGLFQTVEAARKTAQRHLQEAGERGQAKLYDIADVYAYLESRGKALR